MTRTPIATLIALLAISACSSAPPPSSTVPSAKALAPSTPAPTVGQTTAPSAPPTAVAPNPSPAAWPAGRLAYGRFDSRGVTPYTSNIDGTDEQQLLPPPAEGPSWSPDGLLLAVAVESPQGLLGTGTVKPDGSDLVRFDSPDSSLNLGCTVWSPDGSRLACEGWDDTDASRNGIYTVSSTDGGDVTRVTTSPGGFHDIPGDYSLDGNQIFFARSDPEPDNTGDSHMMVVNLDGGDEHQLSYQLMGGGKLSPDGATLLTGSGSYLSLLPVGGGQPTSIRIADASNAYSLGGAWSPDGQWIAFTLHPREALHSDIYIMRSDGTDLRQVTHTPNQDEEFAGWTAAPATAVGVIPLDVGCGATTPRCQDMAAGTYETSGRFAFLPGLTVTLPAGWTAGEQDAGEFFLYQASDPDQLNAIFLWSDVVAWQDGAPRPALGTTRDELAAYLLGDPRMTVVEGSNRTFAIRAPDSLSAIDSVVARSFSVLVSDSAQSDSDMVSDCPGGACIGVLTDTDHWGGPLTLGRNIDVPTSGCPCSQVLRLYIADIGDALDRHTFVISVETAGPDPLQSQHAWEAQVEPIISSVLLPYMIVNN